MSGKQNVATGEIQGCWKRLLRNRPGKAAFRPLGPRGKKKWGSQAPRELRELGSPPASSFEVPQARDLSGPSSTRRIVSKTDAALEQILARG